MANVYTVSASDLDVFDELAGQGQSFMYVFAVTADGRCELFKRQGLVEEESPVDTQFVESNQSYLTNTGGKLENHNFIRVKILSADEHEDCKTNSSGDECCHRIKRFRNCDQLDREERDALRMIRAGFSALREKLRAAIPR